MSKPLTVKVSRRHQITLPREVRERLKIQPGDRLRVEVQNDVLILIPQPENYVQRLAGLHREVWEGVDTTAYLREEREGALSSQRAGEVLQSPHWYEQLQVVARKRGVSVADLIRDILEASEAYTTTRRLEAVERLAQMSLPVDDWEQMERESTT